jgi:hypothetical protein
MLDPLRRDPFGAPVLRATSRMASAEVQLCGAALRRAQGFVQVADMVGQRVGRKVGDG